MEHAADMNTQKFSILLIGVALSIPFVAKATHPTQLTHIIEDGVSNMLNYDQGGNLLLDDQATQFSYNSNNELIKSIQSNGKIIHYRYDAKGQQIAQTLQHQSPVYHYYANNKFIGSQQHHLLKFYFDGGEFKLSRQSNMLETQHYISDNLGSIISHINPDKKLNHYYRYLPFGFISDIDKNDDLMHTPELDQHLKGFNGISMDAMTGNQFLGNGYRAYNPRLGIFLQYDSLSPFSEGGIHGYAYSDNNPVMAFDPSGHIPDWAKHVIVWGVGVTTATAMGMAIAASGGALAPSAAVAHPMIMAAISGAIAGGSASVAAQATNAGLNKQNFAKQMRNGGYVGVAIGTTLGAAGGAVGGSQASASMKLSYGAIMVFSEPAIEQGVMIGAGYQSKWDWESYAISVVKNAASMSVGYNIDNLKAYRVRNALETRLAKADSFTSQTDATHNFITSVNNASTASSKFPQRADSLSTTPNKQFKRINGDHNLTVESSEKPEQQPLHKPFGLITA
ncbi:MULTISPECIES: RHS repeat domain-containing protein [Cysteiniphilum]|uniref:Teneurin-like YD-shell domain-containing protein n=1 Tax=Cysteiniphilum litorale TaxID=2056700 RepID=A0A8J3E909_9GAMM|nr:MULTISPECIES: RHS repeat-associated core domain-containing protein [Cysteiniphilum]WHN66301.1 RHS repeat-associated core domain-containing protein [Cysteiniphilum sp. QT6929]GGF99864.1 hypothetical protein GCM10010995_16470 [Cysteiniphilum litorale]